MSVSSSDFEHPPVSVTAAVPEASTANAAPLLTARGLERRYGGRLVLGGVDVEIVSGEVLAVIGPSGTGKSTLLHLLAGLDRADAGSIVYRVGASTVDFGALSERERTLFRRFHLGFVFQFFNLVPTLDVASNVLLPRRLAGALDDDGPALDRLRQLGIVGRERAYPHQLSGGEQQRVAIARALAHEPALVFADEPTGNLDVRAADEVLDLLMARTHAVGAALVIATHSERLARRAGRVLDLTSVGVSAGGSSTRDGDSQTVATVDHS